MIYTPIKSNGVWCALFELWKQMFLLLNYFDDRLLRLHNQVVCLMAYLTGQQGALTPLSHLIPPLMLLCVCVSTILFFVVSIRLITFRYHSLFIDECFMYVSCPYTKTKLVYSCEIVWYWLNSTNKLTKVPSTGSP